MRRGVAGSVVFALALVSAPLLLPSHRPALATGSCNCGFCTGSPSAACCARKCSTGCGGDHCGAAPPTATPVSTTNPTPTPTHPTTVSGPTPTPTPTHPTTVSGPTSTPTPTHPTTVSGPSLVPPIPPAVGFPPITPISLTPPDPTPTKSIYGHDDDIVLQLDIHPVQVLQDPPHGAEKEEIPLVEDKRTIVRVFVLLPLSMKGLKRATCTLTWGEDEYAITADVIRALGHVWVIPWDKASEGDENSPYRKVIDYLTKNGDKDIPEPAWPSSLRKDYYWAYNYLFDGKGRPFPHDLVLHAKLEARGAVLATKTEKTDKQFHVTQFVGSYDPPNFNVVVAGFASGHVPHDFVDPKTPYTKDTMYDWESVQASPYFEKLITKKAEQYENELLSVYPIPEDALALTINPVLYHIPGFFGGWANADTIAGPGSFSTIIESKYPSADTILLVSNPRQDEHHPEDDFDYGALDSCGCAGWTPFLSRTIHYITCKTSDTALVAAHETGHDSRFFGKGHYWKTRPPVEDGWNAGGHLSGVDTARGREPLMNEEQDEPWVILEEYEKLQDVLCSSSDPMLLSVHGVLEPDGKLTMEPPRVHPGPAPRPQEGAGTLLFTDARGKTLATWSVPLVEVKSRRGFRADAPVPEKARAVTLKLPGDVQRKFAIGAHAPRFEWVDVQATPDGNGLRVKYRASHPDRLPVDLRFVYSPDGRRHYDLETPANAPASGEIVLDVRRLPGSAKAHLGVRATAGLRLTASTSFPFSVPDRPPRLWVDEDTALEGAERYTATCWDPEEGFALVPQWKSEDGAPLGSGKHPDAARLAALRPGRHRITATVRDAAGHDAAASLDTELAAPHRR